MKRSLLAPLSLLMLSLAAHGCGSGGSAAGVDPNDVMTLGSHRVAVKPDCLQKQISNRFPEGKAIYSLTCGRTTVTIDDEQLAVNGQSFGQLNKGDFVLVDHAQVFVNDKKVEAQSRQN